MIDSRTTDFHIVWMKTSAMSPHNEHSASFACVLLVKRASA